MYILYKTNHGCYTVLHLHLLRVEARARRNTGHTTEFPHVFAHALDMELSHSKSICVYKNGSMTLHDYPFVSRQYWSFTIDGLYFRAIIASVFSSYFQNVERPYSC